MRSGITVVKRAFVGSNQRAVIQRLRLEALGVSHTYRGRRMLRNLKCKEVSMWNRLRGFLLTILLVTGVVLGLIIVEFVRYLRAIAMVRRTAPKTEPSAK